MANMNQIVCDRIAAWDLPEDVREIVDNTDFNIITELFGDIGTAEGLIMFVREELQGE